jgi:hypothetical protein
LPLCVIDLVKSSGCDTYPAADQAAERSGMVLVIAPTYPEHENLRRLVTELRGLPGDIHGLAGAAAESYRALYTLLRLRTSALPLGSGFSASGQDSESL